MMLNKVLQSEFVVKDVDHFIYKLGLIRQQNESKKYRLFRYFNTILGLIILVKFWTSISIFILKCHQIDEYKQIIVYLGDLTFYVPKIRIHFNLLLSMFFSQEILFQFYHNKLLLSNGKFNQFKWMKLFEMLSGKIKPSKVGFTHWNDVMLLIKRFDQIKV